MRRYCPWPFQSIALGESFVLHEADYHNAREVARRLRSKELHFTWRQLPDGKYQCTRVEWAPVVLRGPNPYAERFKTLKVCETFTIPHAEYHRAQKLSAYYAKRLGIRLSWRTLADGSHECGRLL
jgi:hypothetical protein